MKGRDGIVHDAPTSHLYNPTNTRNFNYCMGKTVRLDAGARPLTHTQGAKKSAPYCKGQDNKEIKRTILFGGFLFNTAGCLDLGDPES